MTAKAMDRVLKQVNDTRYRESRQQQKANETESLSIGLLYEALDRITLVTNQERFTNLPSEIVKLLSANPDYTDPLNAELRRAFLALHSQKRLQLCSKPM